MEARDRARARITAILVGVLVMSLGGAAQNRLVNMIPQNRSGERNQDSEPTLAIDPNDYNRMAGSAFTWDNLTQGPMLTATAPIYISVDRGATWTLAYIVPSKMGNGFPTGDINLTFGSTLSGSPLHETSWLYGGILSAVTSGYPMSVLRAQDFQDGATVMATLDTRTGNVDQPHTKALSAIAGAPVGQDKLYVGFNNGYSCVAPNGRTSTLDISQNAKVAAPSFALTLIQSRTTACQDGFAQVPAPHLDGTVYAAFIGDWSGSPRVVVVRDDAWGTGGFTALTDPSDSKPGRFVTTALTLQSGTMGQQRLGASNLSIAVDPRNSDRVYVAYGDSNGANSETIHVRRSIDRGQNWSGDLLSATSAMNPQVAINSLGTVGVLYQRLVSGHWEARLRRTTDADATTFDSPGLLLANTNATTPTGTIASSVYVGDYASLQAAGRNFFGMFSASNYPDTATFLPGVVFQRYVDWASHKLYAEAAHTTEVPLSIDPYFFEADTLAPASDFYVRDWTTDATHADKGVEPSTNPVFYTTSDVWNRHNGSPGPFVNDQPTNQDAGNGSGNAGNNWAFARVRRNVTGPSASVTAHFLVSKFGVGSNYVDSTTGDPDVSFLDPDPVIATGAGAGPWTTSAYHWRLSAIAGNHLCLAVQISTPGSPYIPPSLAGATPGWPTTDLRIVNDNHKAQRNMHLSTTAGASGSVSDYAIVHNGALVTRDMPLRIAVSGISKRYVRNAQLRTIGSQRPATVGAVEAAGLGKTLVVPAVQPGENRWVRVDVEAAGLPAGGTAFVTVEELAGDVPVNGFAVGVRTGDLAGAIRDSLNIYRGEAERLVAGFGGKATEPDIKLRSVATGLAYMRFVRGELVPHLRKDLAAVRERGADAFDLEALLRDVETETSAARVVAKVATLLNALDASLTALQLQRGDPADIVQMVRWQKQLFRQNQKVAQLACAPKVIDASSEFIEGRESGKLTNREYPEHLKRVVSCLREAAGIFGGLEGTDFGALQKEHRAYLLALAR